MPEKKILFLLSFLLTGYGYSIGQRPGPPSFRNNANTFDFNYAQPPAPLYQKSCIPPQTPGGSSTCFPPPFWWSFWLFGDGEYYPNHVRPYWQGLQYPVPSSPNAPLPAASHIYPDYGSNSTVDVFAYILSRKSDDPPPTMTSPSIAKQASGKLSVTIPTGGTGFHQDSVIPNGQKIYVEHSHGYYQYPGEESVFAISYNPPMVAGGSVLLFFNSELDPFGMPHAASVFTNGSLYYEPTYTSASIIGGSGNWLTTSAFDLTQTPNTTFQNQFGDLFEWNFTSSYIQNVRNGPVVGSQGEFRIFPQVTTLTAPTGKKAYALAVFLSEHQVAPYNTVQMTRISNILSGVVPGALPNPIMVGRKWVVDVDTIQLKSGEPTDPNICDITSICTCTPDKRHKVFFKLKYVNTGIAAANTVDIELQNLMPAQFSFCDDPVVMDRTGNVLPATWNGQVVHINSLLAKGDSAFVTFSLVADISQKDLRDILQNRHVIGGTVIFPSERNGFLNKKHADDFVIKMLPDTCTSCKCCYFLCLDTWWKKLIAGLFILGAGAGVVLVVRKLIPKQINAA